MDDPVKEKDDAEIVEAEVVSEVTEDQAGVSTDQTTVLLSLEELIKNHIASLEKLATELKTHRDMLEDSFINNTTFREHDQKAKEANKLRSSTRQQITSQPSVSQLHNKVKSMRSEIKERRSALSDYLREYQRMTGANEIEDHEGVLREIVSSAKLVKRSQKQK